eukprot:1138674-Pelagomonas_calceolata.AAC.3
MQGTGKGTEKVGKVAEGGVQEGCCLVVTLGVWCLLACPPEKLAAYTGRQFTYDALALRS